MNMPELESILKRARQPEIPAGSSELFPHQIVAGLKRNRLAIQPDRRTMPRLAWTFGLAACVVIAFAASHWRWPVGSKDALADVKVVRETLAMFPNRLRAIMQDEHGLNLVLSETDDVPVSPPIYVRICDGNRCVACVTFSGQEIQIAGQKVTVLADAHGGIILTGNQFVWSNAERTYAGNHLKIDAKNLGVVAM
jgi:hypothetical protein